MSKCKCGREAGLLSDVCSVCQGAADRHEEFVDTMTANTEAIEEAARAEQESRREAREALEEHQLAVETALERASEEQKQNLERAAEAQKRNLADSWKLTSQSKLKRAQEIKDAGMIPDALALCIEAMESDRGNIEAYILAHKLAKELGNAKADDYLSKAASLANIEENTTNYTAHADILCAFIENNDFSKAIFFLGVGENKTNPWAYAKIIDVLVKTGHNKELEECLGILCENSRNSLLFERGTERLLKALLFAPMTDGLYKQAKHIVENFIHCAVERNNIFNVLAGIASLIQLEKQQTGDVWENYEFLSHVAFLKADRIDEFVRLLKNIDNTIFTSETTKQLHKVLLKWFSDISFLKIRDLQFTKRQEAFVLLNKFEKTGFLP